MPLKSTHKPKEAQAALPEGWTEHTAPTGHSYYYNAGTGQSTYTRPTASAAAPQPAPPLLMDGKQLGTNGTPDGQWPGSDPAAAQHSGLSSHAFGRSQHRRQEPKDRPKSKQAIPGASPWVLVYTKLGRRFVHNPDANESFWKFPAEVLTCVVELDRKERERKERRQRGEPSESEEETKDAKSQANDYDSDEYEEVEVTDDDDGAAASKRPRLEEQADPPPGPREFNEDDIAYQLQAMETEDPEGYDDEAWDDYEEPPLNEEDARGLFFDLLDDHHVNPYTPWDSIVESGKIIDDERYVCLPNMKSRREAWEAWSSDRIQKSKAAKAKQEKKDPKIAYLALLANYATPKLYWAEFKRKYRKEAEMRDTKISDKDREKLYREHINRLKLPESSLKADLTTLLKSLSLRDLNRSTDISMLPLSLVTDMRYISLAAAVRDPLIEGYISMQPEAPAETDKSLEDDAVVAKERLDREKRERALRDREHRVDEEKRKREGALRARKAEAKLAEQELNEAKQFGKQGLLSHLEGDNKDSTEVN